MKKMKVLTVVWGLILIAIFGLLTFLGVQYKEKTKLYKELENALVKSAEKYKDVAEYQLDKNETYKIDVKDLDVKLEVKEDKCKGYVLVKNEGVFTFKTYIKCNKYTTRGYK